jgi:hypothetical protein
VRGLWLLLALLAPALAHADEASPVDLRLNERQVLHRSPLLNDPPPAAREVTAYLGPTLVDGSYARIIDRLPTRVRRTVQSPVGVEPLFLLAGAGLGLYVRMPK